VRPPKGRDPGVAAGTAPEQPPPDRFRVGMALYGDLTYDSRVRKEARTLADAGYDVTIVCLEDRSARADLPTNVRVVVHRSPRPSVTRGSTNPFFRARQGRVAALRARGEWLVAFVRDLRSWGRAAIEAGGPIDIWHAHDLTGLAAIVPNLHATRIPVVYDSHELFIETGTALRLPKPARLMLRAYEHRLVSRASAVITVNDEIAHVLRHRYDPARIEVVHNCPSLPFLPFTASPLRLSAGIPADAPVVLYHGGLTEGRGVEQLLEALLVDGLKDVHLVLMGFGERFDELRSESGSARWRHRLHVLDPVPPSTVLGWVAGADVGAMPNPGVTRNDYFSAPNKLFECFAAGIPVVASDFPTMRRLVMHNPGGPLGALCDPSRVDSIADALRSVLSLGPVEREALRARCLQAAAEQWNWELQSQVLIRVYSEILEFTGRTGVGSASGR
jgi:glycosyltransferase involved in cell wall biosynthesis